MKLFSLACLLFATAAQAAPVTDVRLQNTGAAAQTAVPITFGQVFAVGDVKKTDVLTGSLAGAAVPLQVDVKAAHADGSVRHAIISAVVPKLPTGTTPLAIATGSAAQSGAPASFRDAAATANVTLTIAGVKYTASLADALASTPSPWLAGPVTAEVFADAPLKNAAGAVHPLLTVKYGLRWYPDAKAARVEVIVENTSTWKTANKLTYDVDIQINGKSTYSKAALTHYHHSRWHQYFWAGAAPAVHVQHNTAYLIATRAVSNYEQLAIPEDSIVNLAKSLPAGSVGPMTIGPAMPSMPSTGGRSDIGPLPAWSVLYLLSMDKRAKDVMMAAADGSGSWSIHYRDDNTGAPLRLDNDASKNITTHWNAVNSAPLPNPWFVNGGELTPYTDDVSHHPSLAYVPYLVTGDRFYLEELYFWTTANPLRTVPLWRGFEKGLMRWEQMRGQAWSLRDLGHATYIAPDTEPMKSYFAAQLDANLDFYDATYVKGNPNKLGVYDGSGEFSTQYPTLSPWQDDFLTWSFSYLNDLGFTKAGPIFKWKSRFVLGRMGDEGFCSTMAATYILGMREPDGSVIGSFKRLYDSNFQFNDFYVEGGRKYENLALGSYYDQGCNTPAQAKYLALAYGFNWPVGRLVGSASSPQGTTSNMRPALAAAVDAGMPGAAAAWARFIATPVQPDYRYSPEWDIVPRAGYAVVPAGPVVIDPTPTTPVPTTPVPTTPAPVPTTPVPVPGATIVTAPSVAGTWSIVGYEGYVITVPADTIVRYGSAGSYVFAKVGGTFTASNALFGRDPAVGVGKSVEKFTPSAVVVKPGTITTPSSTSVAKLKGLTYRVFNPVTGALVKEFINIAPNGSNKFTLTDLALSPGVTNLAGAVIDPKTSTAVVVQYPLTVK